MKKIFEEDLEMNFSLVSIKDLFSRLRPLIEFPARIKHLTVRFEINVAHRVEADERRLMQALLNLATNAVKYTSEGRIDITATEQCAAADKRKEVCIVVQDTGMGIKPEHLPDIFKIFGLADAKKDMTGTGKKSGPHD